MPKINEQITQTLTLARKDFKIFVNDIFSLSFAKFTGGQYINELSDWMNANPWFMRVSAKDHFKSTSLYADFMQQLLRYPFENNEYHYFSYQDTMAAYHIYKIKELIKNNPYFQDCKDFKTNAEGVIKYSWDNGKTFTTLEPHGLLGFKRGIHCKGVYVDDPFQDPENKLILTKVYKINNIIKTQILDMPLKGGFCKIVGTPQTNNDFFFDKDMQQKFAVLIQPAEKDPKNKIALWPEHMGWDELQQRKLLRGNKIYNQEYLCSPVYSENSFFTEAEIMKVVNPELQNMSIFDIIKGPENYETIAGWDLGKKRHPAHFTVFQIKDVNGQRKAVQIHQAFFDSWDYAGNNDEIFEPENPTQLSYIKQAIKNFKIDKVFCDNTRGELTTLEERHELPPELILVTFTSKDKYAMATDFEKSVNQEYIELQNDGRQLRQILVVTNDLQAVETPEGHGDSFWSIGLAHKGIKIVFADLSEYTPEQLGQTDSDIYQRQF
jgi:virulence-associated protein VapD